jgi:hypothetical protein
MHVGKITATIKTANVEGAATNGLVYLGLGGREFRLNKQGNQFKKGATDVFIIGDGRNIDNPRSGNDLPFFGESTINAPNIEYTTLDLYPKYIRFEPKSDDDDWNLESASVVAQLYIFDVPQPEISTFLDLPGNIWFGVGTGKVVHLLKV